MSAAVPLAFFLLMAGFGLRLDTAWQGAGLVFIVAGAVALVSRRRGRPAPRAFVPPAGGE
jgi:hypothetical protein